MGAFLNSFERGLDMQTLSKSVVVIVMTVAVGLGGAWPAGASAKLHHKSCGTLEGSKTQLCAKQNVKLKTKKPNPAGGKGISPGLLLLELIL